MNDLDTYLEHFEPARDDGDWVSESPEAFAYRMQSTLLPQWPTEVLIEWLHRHAGFIDKYAFLQYERFQFFNETWEVEKIPDRHAFDDESYCDNFIDIERRAEDPDDWLAQYMLNHRTWNTPIIILENQAGEYKYPNGTALKSPHHLLEGHRRLSFLNGLRQVDKALPQHNIWLVRINMEA